MNCSILQQIAQKAGVSGRTVTRVLSGGNKDVWPSTTKRAANIRRIAEKLNYRPNGAAKAMSSGHFGTISLLLSTDPHRSTLPIELLTGIQEGLQEFDSHLLLARVDDNKLTNADFIPKILREWSSDGLLINYTDHIPSRLIELIKKNNLPSLWLNTKLPADCVYPDNFDAARRATEYLLSLGHRSIAYLQVAGWGNHYSTADRCGGYETVMRQAGREPLILGNLLEVPGPQLKSFLAGHFRAHSVSAVVAYSRPELLAALRANELLGQAGHKAFTGVTFDASVANDAGTPFPTMCIPERTMGNEAVNILMRKIEDPSLLVPPKLLKFGFDVPPESSADHRMRAGDRMRLCRPRIFKGTVVSAGNTTGSPHVAKEARMTG